ncbi:MAG: hypothetical protein LC118_12475 [Dehalococcoidia bacterium]|nr:hypothetical protein [Dehalococcoidia bacterium]
MAPSGLSSTNYRITFVPGMLTVTPADLTLTAVDRTKVYGQDLGFLGTEFTVSGLLNDDAVDTVDLFSAGAVATAGVSGGPYAIAIGNATGRGLANYRLTYQAGALTVTPATLTYVANPASRTYGTANPAFTGTVTGFVNGDTLATATTGSLLFSSLASAASPVGAHALTGSGLSASNYIFTQASGNAMALQVTPAALTIRVLDATRWFATPDPVWNVAYEGLVLNQDASLVSGLTIAAGANRFSSPGDYAITASGATAPNYTISYVPGTLTVLPLSPEEEFARLHPIHTDPAVTAGSGVGVSRFSRQSDAPGESVGGPQGRRYRYFYRATMGGDNRQLYAGLRAWAAASSFSTFTD